MTVLKSGGRVFGARLTNAEQKAIEIEARKAMAEYTRLHRRELQAMRLWVLHERFGFGLKRLREYHDIFDPAIEELARRYEMDETEDDDIWLCSQKLAEYGVDLEEWEKEEIGQNPGEKGRKNADHF